MGKKLSVEEVRRLWKNEGDRRRRANKKFQAADKAGKRVIIAQDVLAQLKLGRIKAKNLTYLESDELAEAIDQADPDVSGHSKEQKEAGQTEVCDIFNKMKSCQACALGGVFVSAVSIKDKLKVKDIAGDSDSYSGSLVDSDKMRKYLGSIFSKRQLFMIENAFEGATVNDLLLPGVTEEGRLGAWGADTCDVELENKCKDFNGGDPAYGGIKSPRVRLERIMNNIIENNGTFVP